jgi:hypothetical protein
MFVCHVLNVAGQRADRMDRRVEQMVDGFQDGIGQAFPGKPLALASRLPRTSSFSRRAISATI